MKNAYINVGNKDWGIVVNYDYDERDYEEMIAIMQSFGMSLKESYKALHILASPNTGMAISNEALRMSAIFVSNATRKSEWWNTLIHEIRHAASAITSYYGVACDGEDDAYLTGYLTKQAIEELGEPCK